MTTFLALYRGPTVAAAELVALSADERLVRDFAERLVTEPPARPPNRGFTPNSNTTKGLGSVASSKDPSP